MVENIYKMDYSQGSTFYFEIDETILVFQKGNRDKLQLYFFDSKMNNKTKKVVITKENFEMFRYFLNLYQDFKLEETLQKQLSIESILKEHSVEYKSFNNEGKTVAKFSMEKDEETITIIIDKLDEERTDFVFTADHKCYPLYNLYNSLVQNFNDKHQIDMEEIIYQQNFQRTRTTSKN